MSGLVRRDWGFDYSVVGFVTRPMKRMAPDSLWRIIRRNGRSALNVGVNGRFSGALELKAMITAVAAAASVPFSLTSRKALCSTLET